MQKVTLQNKHAQHSNGLKKKKKKIETRSLPLPETFIRLKILLSRGGLIKFIRADKQANDPS